MSVGLAALLQAAALGLLLLLAAPPVGRYLAWVYTAPDHWRVERAVYRLVGIDPAADQPWRRYAESLVAFSLVSIAALLLLIQLQGSLPLSLGHGAMPLHQAVNTAVSFVTNTNWQSYSGEQSAGYLLQASGLAVQNFVSAAIGLSVAVAVVRGLTRTNTDRLGNLWVDLVRGTLRVLLPGAALAAMLLVLLGVVQNLAAPQEITTLAGHSQSLLGGPVASQEAIKELGTNGGGFFNANSAHPLENPSPLSNLLEIFLLLLLPFATVSMFGRLVGDRREGRVLGAVMVALLVGLIAVATLSELGHGTQLAQATGGAMEGKEARFGVPASTLFAGATTATSTGAVNASHASLSPFAGGAALLGMALGEVAPGGVGSGLYGMLILAMVAVFLAGLMVGRTPEYLGKRLGPSELKLIAVFILVTPTLVLAGTAIALSLPGPRSSILNPGVHGFTEVLYAFTSAANNNGSAFAGLGAATPFYDLVLALVMALGRFLPILVVLALAGSLAQQRRAPVTAGTLPTNTPLFAALLLGVVLIVAGLTYLPALALGPLSEGLR